MCPPKHPDVKEDEEQGRAKPEQERHPGVAPFLDRFGADLDLVLDQKGFQAGIDKGGQCGREGRRRLGLSARRRPLLTCRGIGDRRRKTAPEGLAPAEDRLDVALPDLLLKQGIGHGDRLGWAWHEEPHQQEVGEQDEHEPEPGPARWHRRLSGTRCGPRLLVGRRSPSGRCGVTIASRLLSRRVHRHLLGSALIA